MEYNLLDYDGLVHLMAKIKSKITREVASGTVVVATGDGANYTATVPGITELANGITITIIPDTTSTATIPKLNVNGLGAKAIRRRVSNSTVTTVASVSENWLYKGKPIRMTYDGTYWIADMDRPNAADIYGRVAVSNGGVPSPADGDDGKVLRVVSGSAVWDNAQPDWNATEGEPGHILNRPFYSEYKIETLLETTTLTANGSFGGLSNVGFLTGLLDIQNGGTYTVVYNGNEYICTARDTTFQGIPCCIMGNSYAFGDPNTGEPFLVCAFSEDVAAQVGAYGGVIPLDGSGTLSVSVFCSGVETRKIDNRFLDMDWIPTVENGLAIVEKQVVNSGDSLNLNGYTFTDGQTVVVEVDEKRYECVVYADDGALIGNAALLDSSATNTGEPFLILAYSSAYVGFADGGVHEFAIYDFSQNGEIYDRLPERFLTIHTHDLATTSKPGFFSAEDKKKLDTIEAHAKPPHESFRMLRFSNQNNVGGISVTASSHVAQVDFFAKNGIEFSQGQYDDDVNIDFVLTSPNGKRFTLSVDNNGNLSTVELT